jgi:hypothetical protein
MLTKQAARNAMVIVYRRIRDDISSLVPILASVITGAELRLPGSAMVRVCAISRSVTTSAYAWSQMPWLTR